MALSFLAYYLHPRKASYRYSTIGFTFIVLGGLISPVYRLGIRSDYHLDATQRLLLQAGEGILLAMGLGLLFYAITRHDASSSSVNDHDATDTDLFGVDDQWHND